MNRPKQSVGLQGLQQAFDEMRFGGNRTLNLRELLPTVDQATARVEIWLRQQQIEKAGEVLVITGRGNNSEAGVSVVREAVIRAFHQLKRKGVVSAHEEHTAGSFVVKLASVSAVYDAAKGKSNANVPPPPRMPPSLDELDEKTRVMLRDLAERVLEGLGVKDTREYLAGEMLKQFGTIAKSVGDVPNREQRLRAAIRAELDRHE